MSRNCMITNTDYSKVRDITKNCETLINQTYADLALFKNEQNQLREQILENIEENNCLNTKLEVLKSATRTLIPCSTNAADSRDDATREQFSNEALKNIKHQIDFLQEENKELHCLYVSSQKTIQNLENEVQNYRNQLFKPNSVAEVKQKYETAIKLLESTIKTQKTEIAKQTQIIENLFEQKHQFRTHIKNLELAMEAKELDLASKLKNEETIERLETQLKALTRQNKELEKSLKLSKTVIEERFDREKRALQKVQEALSIAETAVADKEDAQKREQVLKEECDNLASTIGQVMDEAARKVEKDMEILRKKFLEKEKLLVEMHEKIQAELNSQQKFCQIVETRCNRFENKYSDAMEENEKLTQKLKLATKALDEMELKLSSNEALLKEDNSAKKLTNEYEKQIQQYIQANKIIKEKYKGIIEDIKTKFEKEIIRLQSENAELKAKHQVKQVMQESCTSDCEG